MGAQVIDNIDLKQLRPYIDWTPFFKVWSLAGSYPKILTDKTVGDAATELFRDANLMLDRIIEERLLQAKAVFGFFPANTVEDCVELYTDESRQSVCTEFHFIRQQMPKPQPKPNYCLADFVAPKGSGVNDYIGLFAVTTGLNIEPLVQHYENDHDSYHAILVKAIADRLAEALAEHLHEQVRKTHWGYASDEVLSNEALIREHYAGIRPAPGYPACPDHSKKPAIFKLLNVNEAIGIELTESFAMYPAASVCGYYFSHPQACYFGTGKIGRDQVADFAKRRNITQAEAEQHLATVLGYAV